MSRIKMTRGRLLNRRVLCYTTLPDDITHTILCRINVLYNSILPAASSAPEMNMRSEEEREILWETNSEKRSLNLHPRSTSIIQPQPYAIIPLLDFIPTAFWSHPLEHNEHAA